MSKYTTIICDTNLSEIDIFGLLLAKYTEGTSYDLETHTFTAPASLVKELIAEKEEVLKRRREHQNVKTDESN